MLVDGEEDEATTVVSSGWHSAARVTGSGRVYSRGIYSKKEGPKRTATGVEWAVVGYPTVN
jgi:hypothetical protein